MAKSLLKVTFSKTRTKENALTESNSKPGKLYFTTDEGTGVPDDGRIVPGIVLEGRIVAEKNDYRASQQSVDSYDPLSDDSKDIQKGDSITSALKKVEDKIDAIDDIDTSTLATKDELTIATDTISKEVETKVAKEDGKGLSSNDFTDDEKNKLASVISAPEVTEISLTPDNPKYIIPLSVKTDTEYDYIISVGDEPEEGTAYEIDGSDGLKWMSGEKPEGIVAHTIVTVSVLNNLAVWGMFK